MYGKSERLRDKWSREEKQKRNLKKLVNNMNRRQEKLDKISNEIAQRKLHPKYKGL